MRLELPEGNWAEIRDPKQVPERLRRPVTRAAAQVGVSGFQVGVAADAAQVDAISSLNDAAIVALVSSWSYEAPVSVEAVLDLPGGAYDVLSREAASKVVELMPDFGPNPDPKAPSAS